MITTEVLLRHMQWANQGILAKVAEFPDEALDSYISNPDWKVEKIIRHTADAAGFYNFRLGGSQTDYLPALTTMDQLKELCKSLALYDEELIKKASEEDHTIHGMRDGKPVHWLFSTVLSQAVHHATEHRAQIVQALDFKGFTGISLDDFDLWAYELHLRGE